MRTKFFAIALVAVSLSFTGNVAAAGGHGSSGGSMMHGQGEMHGGGPSPTPHMKGKGDHMEKKEHMGKKGDHMDTRKNHGDDHMRRMMDHGDNASANDEDLDQLFEKRESASGHGHPGTSDR